MLQRFNPLTANMDQRLFHLINEQWTSPILDLFMAAISNIEVWRPLLIALLVYALVFMGFKGRAFVFCLLITLFISDQFFVPTLKNAIGRRRPKQVQTVRMVQMERTQPEFFSLFKKSTVRYSDQTDFTRSGPSFPSGHVTDNIIIATIVPCFSAGAGSTSSSRAQLVIHGSIWALIGQAM